MHPLAKKQETQERIRAERELVLLVNVRSRRGALMHSALGRMFEQRGFRVLSEHPVRDPATQLPSLLSRILAERPRLLVVGGGDGTVATVVGHLAHTDTVLGYLPLGTTNNFGRSPVLPTRRSPAGRRTCSNGISAGWPTGPPRPGRSCRTSRSPRR